MLKQSCKTCFEFCTELYVVWIFKSQNIIYYSALWDNAIIDRELEAIPHPLHIFLFTGIVNIKKMIESHNASYILHLQNEPETRMIWNRHFVHWIHMRCVYIMTHVSKQHIKVWHMHVWLKLSPFWHHSPLSKGVFLSGLIYRSVPRNVHVFCSIETASLHHLPEKAGEDFTTNFPSLEIWHGNIHQPSPMQGKKQKHDHSAIDKCLFVCLLFFFNI